MAANSEVDDWCQCYCRIINAKCESESEQRTSQMPNHHRRWQSIHWITSFYNVLHYYVFQWNDFCVFSTRCHCSRYSQHSREVCDCVWGPHVFHVYLFALLFGQRVHELCDKWKSCQHTNPLCLCICLSHCLLLTSFGLHLSMDYALNRSKFIYEKTQLFIDPATTTATTYTICDQNTFSSSCGRRHPLHILVSVVTIVFTVRPCRNSLSHRVERQ